MPDAAVPNSTATRKPAELAEAIDLSAVAALLSIGKSTAKEWNEAGKLPLPCISEGKVIRWWVTELRAWCFAQCPSRPSWQAVREQRIKQFLAARGAA